MSRLINVEDALTPQDFENKIGVKKMLVTVPVRRPHKQEFFRVHPEWHFPAIIVEIFEDGKTYIVLKECIQFVQSDVKYVSLTPFITAQGNICLWPLKINSGDKVNSWNESAMNAAELAKENWLKLQPNQSLGAYEVYQAKSDIPEPIWPNDCDVMKLVNIAFKDRIIDSGDHPIIRKLEGIL